MKRLVVLACLLAGGCDQVFGLRAGDAGEGLDTDPTRTIRYVESKGAFQNNVASLTLTLDEPMLAGDLVIVVVGTYQGNLQRVTDTGGNQYRQPNGTTSTPNGGKLSVLYAPNVVGATPFRVTATVSPGSSNSLTMAIHSYRGAVEDPLDQHQGNMGGPDRAPTSGTVTTTLDGELYFGAIIHDGPNVTSPGTGFSRRETPTESGYNVPLSTEDMIGPAQTTAATFQLSQPDTWTCALITFK